MFINRAQPEFGQFAIDVTALMALATPSSNSTMGRLAHTPVQGVFGRAPG